MSNLKEWAIHYAEEGYKIFPCVPGGKKPATAHGYKDASSDISQIEKWWTENPSYNIGLPMGKINNIIGLDDDPDDGASAVFRQTVPKTYRTLSPRGGFHHLFEWTEIKNGKILDKGFTIRSDGYYFVAPPSYFKDVGRFYLPEDDRPLWKASLSQIPDHWIFQQNQRISYKNPSEIGNGERHEALKAKAAELKLAGKSCSEILTGLEELNSHFLGGPKPAEELNRLAKWYSEDFKPENRSYEINNLKEEVYETPQPSLSFPVDALGEPMAACAKFLAKTVEAPVELAACSLLSTAALCVQPFINVSAFGRKRPVSLFIISIADSGDRKSTVDQMVLAPVYKWRKEKFDEYNLKLEKFKIEKEAWKKLDKAQKEFTAFPDKPKAPHIITGDMSVEGLFFCLKHHRNSAGLFSDEGGIFVGGYSMKQENTKATLGKLNQIWDGNAIDRMRRGEGEEGEIDILFEKRLSCHLMMQRKVASELLENEMARSQGFLARCLICLPASQAGDRMEFLLDFPVCQDMYVFENKVIQFLNNEPLMMKSLSVCLEAQALLKAFYREVEGEQRPGGRYFQNREFASKAVEHAIRVGAVTSYFNNPEIVHELSAKAVENGIAITRFFLESQLRISDHYQTYGSKDAEIVHQKISTRSVWYLRDLLRVLPRRIRKKDIIIPILEELHRVGMCKWDLSARKITN